MPVACGEGLCGREHQLPARARSAISHADAAGQRGDPLPDCARGGIPHRLDENLHRRGQRGRAPELPDGALLHQSRVPGAHRRHASDCEGAAKGRDSALRLLQHRHPPRDGLPDDCGLRVDDDGREALRGNRGGQEHEYRRVDHAGLSAGVHRLRRQGLLPLAGAGDDCGARETGR